MHRSLLGGLLLAALAGCTSVPTYVLEGGEGGDGGDAGGVGGEKDATTGGNVSCTHCLIFTTHWAGPGNFLGAGGIGTADALCTQSGRTIAGKETSTWKAFVWVNGISPFERLKSPPGGWYSVKLKTTGQEYLVFKSVDAMKTDIPEAALQVTERGEAIGSPMRVWTGGGANRGASNCANWTSAGGDYGVYGDPSTSQQWGEAGDWVCNASGRLYCLEQ